MILADKITEERKKNGWSQEELANQLGVSRQAVSKWESAGAIPDLQRILQMSELFGVSTDYLLKDELDEERIGMLLIIIAVGVNLLIRTRMIKGSYDTLLQEGEFTKEQKQLKKKTA